MKRLLNWKFALAAVMAVLILSGAAILFLPKLIASSQKMNVALKEELVLPALTGPFKVGRTTVYLLDKTRPALPGLTGRREWVVTIFYPAQPAANATPGPYAEESLNSAYTNLALTKESAGALDHIHSNAYWNVESVHSAGKFPVLLFSPGGGEQALFYSSLLEQISSQGYIVVAVPEPFDTPVIPLPDGRVLTKTQLDEWCKQNVPCQKAMKGDDAATQEITKVMKDDRAKDMIFTLNELEIVNRKNPFLAGIFDFDKIGAFGHSFGGASAVRLGQLDQRIGAVAVLDSDIFYVIPEDSKPLFQPVLFMTAANIDASTQELASIGKSDSLTSAYFRKHSPYYFIKIAGTAHQSFQTDALFLAPFITIGGQSVTLHAGDTTPARISQVISTYVMAFFDQHLNGIEQPLLNGASDAYPEISIEVKKIR
jgi:hypothetical protein